MDITQLQYFLSIARVGSFTKAAGECYVSQPAVSQQIARLEEELGLPVFERQGRQVKLTDAGMILRQRAEQIMALLEDVKREITDDGETGHLVVGAIPTIAPYFLPQVLQSFHSSHPQARVEVVEAVTEELLKNCEQGDIDVGLLALPVEAKHLDTEELFEEELLLVVPAAHRLAAQKTIKVRSLTAEPFILLNDAHCLSGNVSDFCSLQSFQPIETGRTNQLATVQQLVSLGQGVSFVPHMAADVDRDSSRVYRSLSGAKPIRKVACCYNAYRYQTKLQQNFVQCLREAVASH